MTKVPLFILAFTLILIAAALTRLGSVVVLDPTHRADTVSLENGIQLQKLWGLPWGIFVAIPRVEGVVRIDCRDKPSRSLTFGYVTPGIHSRFELKGGCSSGTPTAID